MSMQAPKAADTTTELLRFLKVLGDHPTNFPAAQMMVDGMLELDTGSIKKLREHLIGLGIRPTPDGLIQAWNKGLIIMQVSDTVWLRVLLNPMILHGYGFELMLQNVGLDLKTILRFHDALSKPASSPDEDSHVCPNCRKTFTNKDEEFARGFGTARWSSSITRGWPTYGGYDEPPSG